MATAPMLRHRLLAHRPHWPLFIEKAKTPVLAITLLLTEQWPAFSLSFSNLLRAIKRASCCAGLQRLALDFELQPTMILLNRLYDVHLSFFVAVFHLRKARAADDRSPMLQRTGQLNVSVGEGERKRFEKIQQGERKRERKSSSASVNR